MADAPPAASGQRSVTLDIGAIGSGLGDGIDIEEAYRLVAAAMENDAELMAAVGAARERAVETVRGNLAAKSARGGLEEYRRALDAEFEGTIDALTASMGMTASPDQKNTFNSAFDAFAAANASIYKSSADFRRECVDLLAKRALAELGSPVPADFDAQSRISDYIGELSREQAAKTISSLHGLKVSEVLAAGRKRIAQARTNSKLFHKQLNRAAVGLADEHGPYAPVPAAEEEFDMCVPLMDGTIEENSEEVAEFSRELDRTGIRYKFSELAAAGSAKVQTCLEFMSRDIKAVQAACTRAAQNISARGRAFADKVKCVPFVLSAAAQGISDAVRDAAARTARPSGAHYRPRRAQ